MKKGTKRAITWTVIAVIIAAAIFMVAGKRKALQQVTYDTVPVEKGDVAYFVTATGTIEPVTEVEVGTQVSGIIAKLYADYNSTVKEGQIIAEMDKVTLESDLASARATYDGNRAEYVYQEKNYARSKGLHEKNLISDTEYEQAEYNFSMAKSAYENSKAALAKAERNLSYATIVSRYFDAGYTLIAHSGQGAVRNYGDSLRVSEVCMQERMLRTFDSDTVAWKPSYVPDLVVINLGSNDFSLPPYPTEEEFVDGYCNLLSQVRTLYGDIPVICVCPPTTGEPLNGYLRKAKDRMEGSPVYVIELTKGLYNDTSDLGSVWHPNYSGQLKMAMGLIPYISTVTGWEMVPGKPVE